jgi:FG-GAP-like repeat
MKHLIQCLASTGIAVILLISCENQKEERLAKQYCSSCHLFTPPSLLDKKNWEANVLPEMAFRMGFPSTEKLTILSPEDLDIVVAALPGRPMISEADWNAIKNYYLTNAPDSIPAAPHHTLDTTLHQFDLSMIEIPGVFPLITLVKTDTATNKTWVGTRAAKLFVMNQSLAVEDSFQLTSPPSHIHFENKNEAIISAMGIMDPNDQSKGQLQLVSRESHKAIPFIDSLKRPVYFEKADLNGDQLDDYVVCGFGNYTGALIAYENKGSGKFNKHLLLNQPGARKVIITDANEDGLKDILVLMTQGDEQISLLSNAGNFNFKITSLLRFPPVYGSSFFDVADFNGDGKFDILYTNGDNADYSITLKSYHGVHVFLNDGKNRFNESWTYPMNGASEALARDFDGDGDLDIAAISFFPDFRYPEEGFLYFENTGQSFTPHTTPMAARGRWLVMEAADFDDDGDEDIILGALNFNNGTPDALRKKWAEKQNSLFVLRNKLK